MSRLLPLRHYVSAPEAYQLRSLLEQEGIPVFLDGEAAASMMPHLGTAIDVRLLVPAEHLTRAEQWVAAFQQRARENRDAVPWYCGACDEPVEAGFEVCWSCGRDRQEVEAEPATSPATSAQAEDFEVPNPRTVRSDDLANPYAATSLAADFSALSSPWTGDEELVLQRARRAAVIGIGFFPIVMNVYSLWLLSSLPRVRPEHPAARRQVRWTVGLNAVAIIGWILVGVTLTLMR